MPPIKNMSNIWPGNKYTFVSILVQIIIQYLVTITNIHCNKNRVCLGHQNLSTFTTGNQWRFFLATLPLTKEEIVKGLYINV